MGKTSYWRQKNRADAAETELRALKIRVNALVNNWALVAKRSAAGSPVESLCDQHSRELKDALVKAAAATSAPEPAASAA